MGISQEFQIKHVELIQGIITRQAQNSFTIKGWSITLASALFTILLQQRSHPLTFLIVIAPAFLFWWFDVYYLRQERLFRMLYEAVALDISKGQDPPSVPLFSLDVSPYRNICGWWDIAQSSTSSIVPMAIAVVAIVLLIAFSLVT
jgi:hypothetical protein